MVDLARENGLSLMTFPPHCSHRLQPLDVAVCGPFKKFYSKAVNEWNISHPGSRITIYDLPPCFTRAFNAAFLYANITKAFEKTEIQPLNSDIFTDDDFLPSEVFLRGACSRPEDRSADTHERPSVTPDRSTSVPCNPTVETPGPSGRSLDPAAKSPLPEQAPVSDSRDIFTVSFEDIRPLPKAPEKNPTTRSRGRKRGKSQVLTSTPIRDEIAARPIGAKGKKAKQNACPRRLSEHEMFHHQEQQIIELKERCYAIVQIVPENSEQPKFFVCQIISVHDDKSCQVTYLRKSEKMRDTFVKPVVEDIADVNAEDVLECLPDPVTAGKTARFSRSVKFNFDFSPYARNMG